MTGAGEWTLANGSTHRTGFWADEAAVPVDPASLSPAATGGVDNAAAVRAVLEAAEFGTPVALAEGGWRTTTRCTSPGGHGPMQDLSVNADSGGC